MSDKSGWPGRWVGGDQKRAFDRQPSGTDEVMVDQYRDKIWMTGNRIERDEYIEMTGDWPDLTC